MVVFLIYTTQTFLPVVLAYSYALEREEYVSVYFVNPRKHLHPIVYSKGVRNVEITVPIGKPAMEQIEEATRYKFVVFNPTYTFPINIHDERFLTRKRITIVGLHSLEGIPQSNLLIINKVPSFAIDMAKNLAEKAIATNVAEGVVIIPMCKRLFTPWSEVVVSQTLGMILVMLEEDRMFHHGSILVLTCDQFRKLSEGIGTSKIS